MFHLGLELLYLLLPLFQSCSVWWVFLFCCLCRFVSRPRFRVFRSVTCFFRVSFSSCNFFIVFMLFSFSMFEFLVCCRFSLLILSTYFLISSSSFFLSFCSCFFCFNMIYCVFIFDFIFTLSFINIFQVFFSLCSCIFKSLIYWPLSDTWFILILPQFPTALTTVSNIFFCWLIFVISFYFCCSFCLFFSYCAFNWSNQIFISFFSFIILSWILLIVCTSLCFNSYWLLTLSFGHFYMCSVFPLGTISGFPFRLCLNICSDIIYNNFHIAH